MRSVMILPGRGDFGELILKDNFGGSEVKGREKMCVWVGPWALAVPFTRGHGFDDSSSCPTQEINPA